MCLKGFCLAGACVSTTETSDTGLDLRMVRIVGFPRFPRLALRTSVALSSCRLGRGWSSSDSISRYAPRISDSAGPDPQLEGIARLDAKDAFVKRGSASSSGIGETDDRRARGGRRVFGGATRPAVRCFGSLWEEGSAGGKGIGKGGTSGIEDVDEAVDCLNRSSVAIEIRGATSIVLVGLTGASFLIGRRSCSGGGRCNCEKDRGGLGV